MRHFVHAIYVAVTAACGAAFVVGSDTLARYGSIGGLVIACAAIVTGIRRYRPVDRAPWVVFGSALGVFVAILTVMEIAAAVAGRPVVPLVVSDVAFFVGYLLLFAWAGLLIRANGRLRALGDRLDFLLMVTALVVPLWLLVLEPIVRNSTLSGGAKVGVLAHPVMTAALFAVLLRVALAGTASLSLRLVLCGLTTTLVADILLVAARANDPDLQSGRWSQVLWWVSTSVITVAALHPSMRTIHDSRKASGVARLTWVRMVGIAAALLAPTTTGVLVHRVRHEVDPAVIVGPVVVMTTLLLLRLRDLLRQSERARCEVERQERYFRSIALNLSDALVVTDHDGVVTDSSPAFEAVFESSGIGDPLTDALPGTEVPHLLLQVRTRPDTTAVREVSWSDAGGRRRWFEVTAANMLDNEAVHAVVWVLRDISERHAFTEQLRHQALHDELTGLPNRVLMADRLRTALARARRTDGSVAVFFVDLDNFKTINDGLGHEAGDRLLMTVAERLRGSLREADTLSRLGGDEFAVVAEGLDHEGARETACRLRDALAQPFTLDGARVPVTASIGVSCGCPEDPEELLREADVAMYHAKAAGKDDLAVFEEEMRLPVTERLETELELLAALEHDEFTLVYQPIVDVATGAVDGAEALLRWHHPTKGELPPLRFVPVAEECGLMVPIGLWVLRTACSEAASWSQPLTIAVNVSARQLDSPSFGADVRAVLAETGLDPARLVLEITESTVVRDGVRGIERLLDLRSLGVRIAVDDFGTGYSSLGRLRTWTVDILKIDRSFVAELGRSPSGGAMVDALLGMARALQLEAVAEGVEDEAQAAALRDSACDSAQGYYFARPMPVEDFRALADVDNRVESA